MHRVAGSVLGAILVTGTVAAAVVGLPTVASAATQEASSITLGLITTPVVYGSESQVFKGTVTGQTGDGYPTTGTVQVVASLTGSATTTPLCTGSLTGGKTDVATFTCDQTTATLLAASGPYTVIAKYTGGASSDATYSYGASTSNPLALTVTPASMTPTVTLSAITSTVSYGSDLHP